MKRMVLICLLGLLAGGCAPKVVLPDPAPPFKGQLAESLDGPEILGEGWKRELGIVSDDMAHPPTVPPKRRSWAITFFGQQLAAGARSYAEVYYFQPSGKVVTLYVLVYDEPQFARDRWNQVYGQGNQKFGYQVEHSLGDTAVRGKERNSLVILASNVILESNMTADGPENETVARHYLEKLGVSPAGPMAGNASGK